jgi:hypothetical protein
MKRQLAVAILTTVVAACSDPATSPLVRPPRLSATVSQDVQRVVIEDTEIFPVPRGCTGEPVEWHLRQESTLREMTDANGGFHGTFTFHDMGSYGVGLVTGAMYRLAQTQNESFNVGGTGLPITDTAIFLRRFISQGSLENFRVTNIFHYTIDANGTMTSFRNTSERICD